MKKYSVILFCLLLTACSAVTPSPTTTPTPLPTATATATPLPPTPTATATPAFVDIAALHANVLTDPWNATQEEKAAFDADVESDWHQKLAAVGVENADSLEGYDLLNAIVEYKQQDVIKENETPAEQEAHIVDLPFSMHELLRTDTTNLVQYHMDSTRKVAYGVGKGMSPPPTYEEMMSYIKVMPDFNVFGKNIHTNAADFMYEGDVMFLYREPGTKIQDGFGAVLRMYDGDQVKYIEISFHTTPTVSKQGDMCSTMSGVITAYACPVGKEMPASILIDHDNTKNETTLTLSDMLKLLRQYKAPHISDVNILELPLWSDGVKNEYYIYTPSISK